MVTADAFADAYAHACMHVLGTAMLHYTNPNARAVAFAQSYSFKAGLKKFGDVGKTAAMTELTQLHTYET